MSAKLGRGMRVKATQEVYNIPQGKGLNKELNTSELKGFAKLPHLDKSG